jgi:hypothetical protein
VLEKISGWFFLCFVEASAGIAPLAPFLWGVADIILQRTYRAANVRR